MNQRFIRIATLQRPHGFRGAFVASLPSPSENLAIGTSIWIRHGATIRGPYEITESDNMPKGCRLKLRGIEDDVTVKQLRGGEIVIPRDSAKAPPKGEYYIEDLIGLKVVDADSNDPIGTLTGIESLDTPDNLGALDRWWVTMADGHEFAFLPAKQFLVSVSMSSGEIRIRNWKELSQL